MSANTIPTISLTTINDHDGVTRTVRGCCPHDCPDTCATLVDVRDGEAVGFRGDPAHPFTQGWLCAKVRPYLDRVYHPDRLLYPLRRAGAKGAGRWQRISWDEALAEIAERWQGIIATDGAAAILPYSYSGTLGLVQNIVTSARLFGRMGASDLYDPICDAAVNAAIAATLGKAHGADFPDVLHSKLVLIWGHNPASTSPHYMPWLRQAQRSGARIVVIDPRRTITARSADLHLQPRPGTDGALALGLMHVIFRDNLHDEPWLASHSTGWEALRDHTRAWNPAATAAATGIEADAIEALAREYATTKPALLKIADGIQRHLNGGQTSRALLCLPALVGQYGTRGGGLAYSSSGFIRWDWQAMTHAAESPPTPRAINMNRIGAALNGEADDPPLKSLYVFNANPVSSSSNSAAIVRGLQRDDLFTVVHELFMTDTAQFADIVLPATTQLEHTDLHKGYGHRFLQYNAAAIAPRGEARSNWDTMRSLAAALGYTEPWLHAEVDEIIAEVLDASRAGNPALGCTTLEQLQEQGTVPYTMAEAPHDVPYHGGVFPTPSGRIDLYSTAMLEQGQPPLPTYVPLPTPSSPGTLALLSGAAHHYVSSSMANLPTLQRREGTPFVEINPQDATARGIADGQQVVLENDVGSCLLRAVVTDDVPPGVLVSPKGNWARNAPGGRNVNWLMSDDVADLAGQSTYHSARVRVRHATDADNANAIAWPFSIEADDGDVAQASERSTRSHQAGTP